MIFAGLMALIREAAALIDLTLQAGNLGASYGDTKTGVINQTCTVTITFNENGTWTASGNGGVLTGSPTSGNWGTPTTTGAGALYEINVVDNGGTGTASGATGAGVWVALTSGRAVSNSVTDTTIDDGGVSASRSFTATIRKIGTTTPTFTDTFSLNPTADKSSA